MPSFFQFTQGTESRVRPVDTSPLLGRFRAVPPRPGLGQHRSSRLGLFSDRLAEAGGRGSVHVGYGALVAAELRGGQDDSDDDDVSDHGLDDDATVWETIWKRWVLDLWVDPRQPAVKRVLRRWWSRYGLLVFLPAMLVGLMGTW